MFSNLLEISFKGSSLSLFSFANYQKLSCFELDKGTYYLYKSIAILENIKNINYEYEINNLLNLEIENIEHLYILDSYHELTKRFKKSIVDEFLMSICSQIKKLVFQMTLDSNMKNQNACLTPNRLQFQKYQK